MSRRSTKVCLQKLTKVKKIIIMKYFVCFPVISNVFLVFILAQLYDLMQLKQENSYLTTIARQISPYILSIAKVKERLEPRCCIQMYFFHVGHLLS